MEIWYGTPASDYDSLHIFNCPSYYHVLKNNLDPKSTKIIFFHFSSGIKGYYLWYSLQKKIIVGMNVVLSENVILKQVGVQSSKKECLSKRVSQKIKFGC